MKQTFKKLIKKAATQIDRERDAFASSMGFTGTQMSVIDYLSNCDNYLSDQTAIEHEFGIRRSTTTIMINRMEKHGLVNRIADQHDKRKKKVKLTEKSLSLVARIKKHMKEEDQQLMHNLTIDQVKLIKIFLEEVISGRLNE